MIPRTIRELTALDQWQSFIADKLGNDLFFTDPDRANRIQEAAENGADGSTHAEVIDDWREFADLMRREWLHRAFCEGDEKGEAEIEGAFDALTEELDACEQRHATAGTLHEEIG